MLVYKVVNIFNGNLTDKYVDVGKINAEAADGWKLIAITVPPNSQNNRWVSGTFVRDELIKVDVPVIDKPRLGRPPKEKVE